MHMVKISALALLILGAIRNLCHCSSCYRPHHHVKRVHCFTFKFYYDLSMITIHKTFDTPSVHLCKSRNDGHASYSSTKIPCFHFCPRVGRSTRSSSSLHRFSSLTPPAPSLPSLTLHRCRLLPLTPRRRPLPLGPCMNPLFLSLSRPHQRPRSKGYFFMRGIWTCVRWRWIGDWRRGICVRQRGICVLLHPRAPFWAAAVSPSSCPSCCFLEVLPHGWSRQGRSWARRVGHERRCHRHNGWLGT
jgi:hypothetical protein